MENAFKLEEEFAKETAGGRDPSDPHKHPFPENVHRCDSVSNRFF